MTAALAFNEWLQGKAGDAKLWLQQAKFPCNDCCQGGQG